MTRSDKFCLPKFRTDADNNFSDIHPTDALVVRLAKDIVEAGRGTWAEGAGGQRAWARRKGGGATGVGMAEGRDDASGGLGWFEGVD